MAIFNGDNPWKDDEEGCHSDAESLFECGKRRKRTPRWGPKSSDSSLFITHFISLASLRQYFEAFIFFE